MVSDIKFRKPKSTKKGSKVAAEGTLVFRDKILLPFKVIRGPRGLFVGYLSEKRDGEWVPLVDIFDREWKNQVQEEVLAAWEEFKKGK